MKSKHLLRNSLLLIIALIIIFAIYSAFNPDIKPKDINLVDSNIEYQTYFCPEDDCNAILYNTLNEAETIDCAVYDITLNWIYDLIKDKNTRIITDNDEITNYGKQFSFVKTDNSNDYMHNKFCTLDSNLLLIGSLNFTADATLKQNNNFIITNNKDLINKAQNQFNTLWANEFNKGSNYNNICFSPGNCINHYLIQTENTKQSIKCMQFSFTYDELAKKLIEKQKQGLDIKIILEKSQNSQYSEYQSLKDKNINVIWDLNPSFMHNKFCIFDSNVVITGSMNLSNNGNFNNNESIVIINDYKTIKEYENYFNKYYTMWS